MSCLYLNFCAGSIKPCGHFLASLLQTLGKMRRLKFQCLCQPSLNCTISTCPRFLFVSTHGFCFSFEASSAHKVNVPVPTLSVEVEIERDTALSLLVDGGEWVTSGLVYSILEEPSWPCFWIESVWTCLGDVKCLPWKESNPDSFVLQPIT